MNVRLVPVIRRAGAGHKKQQAGNEDNNESGFQFHDRIISNDFFERNLIRMDSQKSLRGTARGGKNVEANKNLFPAAAIQIVHFRRVAFIFKISGFRQNFRRNKDQQSVSNRYDYNAVIAQSIKHFTVFRNTPEIAPI